MSEHATTLRKKLDAATIELRQKSIELVIAHQQCEKLQKELYDVGGQAKKAWTTSERIQFWLNVVTTVSIIAFVAGTYYTAKHDEKTRLMPIVVLGTQDVLTDANHPRHMVVIRNVGFGPALNIGNSELTVVVPDKNGVKKNVQLRLNHRTTIGAGEVEYVNGERTSAEESNKTYARITADMLNPPFTRGTASADLAVLLPREAANAIPVCIGYKDAHGEGYETWQMMYQPPISTPQDPDMAIDYRCKREAQKPCGEGEKVDEACPKQ